jgi:HD-GYP domain-containing protein (c-di-GMP phosphodiesterase class II)
MAFTIDVPLKDFVISISNAIDLATPLLAGHHKRVAYLAWNIADAMGLGESEKERIITAALIHDVGCLSLQDRLDTLEFEIRNPGYHCRVGELVLREFKPLKEVAKIIGRHHTPWAGGDWSGAAGPVEAHVIHLADRIDILVDRGDKILHQEDRVFGRVAEESGKKFLPEAIDSLDLLRKNEAFWLYMNPHFIDSKLVEYVAPSSLLLSAGELESFAGIFSYLIDFKSSFTASHTAGVTAVASEIARLLDFTEEEVDMMKIAGFLHDIGKLAVPKEILEKQAKLDFAEFSVIREHTFLTYNILKPIQGFETINEWASFHHETLEGSGYPFHIEAGALSLGSRVMKVADIFTALTEDRPYRKGMEAKQVIETFRDFIDAKSVDPEVFNTVLENYDRVDGVREESQRAAARKYEEFLEEVKESSGG